MPPIWFSSGVARGLPHVSVSGGLAAGAASPRATSFGSSSTQRWVHAKALRHAEGSAPGCPASAGPIVGMDRGGPIVRGRAQGWVHVKTVARGTDRSHPKCGTGAMASALARPSCFLSRSFRDAPRQVGWVELGMSTCSVRSAMWISVAHRALGCRVRAAGGVWLLGSRNRRSATGAPLLSSRRRASPPATDEEDRNERCVWSEP